MTRRPPTIATVLVGIIVGAVGAIVVLWPPYPVSWRGLLGVLGAGAAFGLVLASFLVLADRWITRALVPASALGGVAGGAAWWLVVRPPSALIIAMLFGAALAVGAVVLEGRFGKAAA